MSVLTVDRPPIPPPTIRIRMSRGPELAMVEVVQLDVTIWGVQCCGLPVVGC